MRQRWLDLKAAVREFLNPRWEQEDRPDLEADAAVRTDWVRRHRVEGGEPT